MVTARRDRDARQPWPDRIHPCKAHPGPFVSRRDAAQDVPGGRGGGGGMRLYAGILRESKRGDSDMLYFVATQHLGLYTTLSARVGSRAVFGNARVQSGSAISNHIQKADVVYTRCQK